MRILSESDIRCAELVVTRYFELNGSGKAPVQEVIQYGRMSGLKRAEIKEARKRLGIESVNENGAYWWIWPNDKDPGEVNKQISDEVMLNDIQTTRLSGTLYQQDSGSKKTRLISGYGLRSWKNCNNADGHPGTKV